GGMYRSNWDLSAARAASVAHELLAAGVEPARLMVSGHADTQPRVANDSPEHRAQNRRVDITFVAGKDRHGGPPGDTGGDADRCAFDPPPPRDIDRKLRRVPLATPKVHAVLAGIIFTSPRS